MACPHCKVDGMISNDSCRTWGRLGASARGLFGGYKFQHTVSSRTTAKSGNVTFESGGGSLASGGTGAYLLGEYRFPNSSSVSAVKFDTVGGVEFRSRWDKLLDTAGLSWSNRLTVGSEGACGDISVQDLEYQTKQVAFGLGLQSANPLTSKQRKAVVEATSSVNVGDTGLTIAGQTKLDAGEARLLDFNVGAEYASGPITTTLKTTKSMTGLTAAYFHKLWSDVDAGIEADFKRTGVDTVSTGVEYRLYRETTVKGKVNSLGTVSTAVEHRLADPRLKFGLSTSFDLSGPDRLVANKFGLSMTFGDGSAPAFGGVC